MGLSEREKTFICVCVFQSFKRDWVLNNFLQGWYPKFEAMPLSVTVALKGKANCQRKDKTMSNCTG